MQCSGRQQQQQQSDFCAERRRGGEEISILMVGFYRLASSKLCELVNFDPEYLAHIPAFLVLDCSAFRESSCGLGSKFRSRIIDSIAKWIRNKDEDSQR